MTQITINLSDPDAKRMEAIAAERGFSSVSEYLQALVLMDQQVADQRETEAALREGLQSQWEAVTPEFWADRRRALRSA